MTCGECKRGKPYSAVAVVCPPPERVPIWVSDRIGPVIRLKIEDAYKCPCFERKEEER